jgi:hypothetical protein
MGRLCFLEQTHLLWWRGWFFFHFFAQGCHLFQNLRDALKSSSSTRFKLG